MTPDGYLVGTARCPTVVVQRELAASAEEVWSAWTDPERLARWLGAVDAPLTAPGGRVHMAMAAETLPPDPGDAENPAVITVLEASPPAVGRPGRLVFRFEDASDPGGTVTVTMTPAGIARCQLQLVHALSPRDEAIEQAPAFGAGWEGFLDWLADVLAGRSHGADDAYDTLLPYYETLARRLGRVRAGNVADSIAGDEGCPTVRHVRAIEAPADMVWSLLTDSASLPRWLGEVVAGALGPDGTVSVVHEPDDPDGSRQTSRVLVWDPPRVLELTWDYPGEAPSTVRFTLDDEDGITVLTLQHRGVGAEGDGYLPGWHAHLDALVAVAEGTAPPPFWPAFEAAVRATRT
jgi:uncharacterized protein YndB with AHSA1/START domain